MLTHLDQLMMFSLAAQWNLKAYPSSAFCHNVMRNKGWRVNVQSIKCVVVLHLGQNLVTLGHLFTFRGQTAGFGTILVPTLLIKRHSVRAHMLSKMWKCLQIIFFFSSCTYLFLPPNLKCTQCNK